MNLEDYFHKMLVKLVLWAALAFWVLEAYLNARFGNRLMGPGLAAVSICLAIFAAWLPIMIRQRWRTKAKSTYVLIAACVVCVAYSQVAGWATVGTLLADGLAERDDAATSRSVVKETLDAKRAELRKLAALPAPNEIEKQIEASLSTVIRQSGKSVKEASKDCSDPAAAPNTCRKVAELRTDLERARSKVRLETEVQGTTTKLEKTAKVSEGRPEFDVVMRITGAEKDEVKFWMPVAITMVIGLFANFGFVLAGMGRGPLPPSPPPLDYYSSLPDNWRPRHPQLTYSPDAAARPAHVEVWPVPGSFQGHAPVFYPPGTPPATPGAPVSAHGAPITINMSSPGPVAPPALTPPAGPSGPPPSLSGQSPDQAMAAARTSAVQQSAPIQARTPDAAKRPVDNSPGLELMHQMSVFKAACLKVHEGALIRLDDIWQRYQSWAGPRGMDRAAFETMFPLLTRHERVDFGGVAHIKGVELAEAKLAVAS